MILMSLMNNRDVLTYVQRYSDPDSVVICFPPIRRTNVGFGRWPLSRFARGSGSDGFEGKGTVGASVDDRAGQ